MRYVIPLAIIAGLGATVALAEIPARDRKTDAQPRAFIAADLRASYEKMGYEVRRLKAEDRHYEAYLVERKSGGAVEATYDKTSGELLGARPASESHEAREHEEARERREPRKGEETHERAGADQDRDSHAHQRRHADD